MVSEHPWVTLGFFALGIVVVFWVIRGLIMNEEISQKSGKEARLD
jgi:hypothetical protein